MNVSTNLPGGMTHADYNRLVLSKVEFVRVSELPTTYIKEYPTIYIVTKDETSGVMYEYIASTQSWVKYGGDLGIIPITGEEYDALSEEEKNKDVFYLITDRIAYLEDVEVMKGSTATENGKSGLVPAPSTGDTDKFLRGDGTWAEADVSKSFTNITISTSTWTADTTYTDYPYKTNITCSGVDSTYSSQVIFGCEDATGGNFAPINDTTENTVTVYAKEIPENNVVIPLIISRKVVTV